MIFLVSIITICIVLITFSLSNRIFRNLEILYYSLKNIVNPFKSGDFVELKNDNPLKSVYIYGVIEHCGSGKMSIQMYNDLNQKASHLNFYCSWEVQKNYKKSSRQKAIEMIEDLVK